MNKEIGAELKASNLKPGTVVVIFPPGQIDALTMWVQSVDLDAGLVIFSSNVLHWSVLSFIQPDGSIEDDQGRTVRVHEYLGKV